MTYNTHLEKCKRVLNINDHQLAVIRGCIRHEFRPRLVYFGKLTGDPYRRLLRTVIFPCLLVAFPSVFNPENLHNERTEAAMCVRRLVMLEK
ncbi:hypothetical protein BBP40_012459, partial [Aspergillus hancockii]